jgi:osmotically-inducible protein OsmY
MGRLTGVVAVVATAVVLTGCTALQQPFVQYVYDTSTTTEIKTRLAMDGRLGSLGSVGVTTTDDMVRLTGTVASEAERQRVESIARSVAGDNRVINELRISGSPAASPRVQKE